MVKRDSYLYPISYTISSELLGKYAWPRLWSLEFANVRYSIEKLIRDLLLDCSSIFIIYVTIFKLFIVDITTTLTLTFIIDQRQMNICELKARGMNSSLVVIVILDLSLIISIIFALRMCMTLTIRMCQYIWTSPRYSQTKMCVTLILTLRRCQCQIKECQSKSHAWLFIRRQLYFLPYLSAFTRY